MHGLNNLLVPLCLWTHASHLYVSGLMRWSILAGIIGYVVITQLLSWWDMDPEGWYAPVWILGPPECYPYYGDCYTAWLQNYFQVG